MPELSDVRPSIGSIKGADESASGSEKSVPQEHKHSNQIKDDNDDAGGERLQEDTDYEMETNPPENNTQGLVTLWQPPENGDIRLLRNYFLNDFDIVIVHGLWGARKPPWKNPGAGSSDWLETQGQCGKVMAFGYDPSRLLSGRHTRQSISTLATMLLDTLMAKRNKATKKRSIIFVAHDLGGTIVKSALTTAGLNPRLYGEVFDFSRILIFYGCPHRASNIEELEEYLTRFLYRSDSILEPRVPSPVGTTKHLAMAVAATNSLFLESKHMFQSYAISIYSDSDSADVDKAFSIFTGTMGMPFEICLASSLDNYVQIKNHVKSIRSLVRIDSNTLGYERYLLSAASPIPPLGLDLAADHPFAWITTNGRYKLWRNERRPQLLYLHGQSNTQSASEYIFHDLNKLDLENNREVTLYFTFDRYDLRRNSIQDMFATFLAQILGHFRTPADSLKNQFEQHRHDRSWNYKDLVNWFEYHRDSPEIKGIACVLNHFDECEPTSRSAFLADFSSISEAQERPWRVLITTQEPRVLLKELCNWPALDLDQSSSSPETYRELAITRSATYFDKVSSLIASPEMRYFKTQVNNDIQFIRSLEPNVQELILEHVSKHKYWPSQRCISDILGPIDDMGLESVVGKILSNIPDQYFALHALSWILYAVRPPTLWELAAAVTRTEEHAADNPVFFASPVDEVHDRLQTWLAGIVTIRHNEAVISTRRIREILTTTPSFDSGTPSLANRINKTAHTNIVRTCLTYLTISETKIGLQDVYDNSRYNDTHLAMICDRTSLHNYATQFWVHHLSLSYAEFYPSEDIESFVESGAVSSWAQARWVLANPFTRSQQPFKSLYPALAGIGLVDQAECWLAGADDLPAGLIEACYNASLQTARQLLLRLQHTVESLNEALTAAGANGNEAAWIALINTIQEICPDFPWKTRGALVARAGWLGLEKVVFKLLQLGCPADELDPARSTPKPPIQLAVRANSMDATKLLLDHGADPKRVLKYKETLVHIAAYCGHAEMIKLLTSHGTDPNALNSRMVSPILFASLWGRSKAVEALIELGANPNLKPAENQDEPGWSPLLYAIDQRNIYCAHALINGNADPNIVGYDGTPLRYAVVKGLLEICENLLEKHANIFHDSITPPILICATSTATCENRLEIIRLLVDKGARINAEDDEGNTALSWACWSDDPQRLSIVEYLLVQGADVNCHNHDGTRPLHIAISRGDTSLLSLLLQQENIELNTLGPKNKTPLIMAIHNASMVKMLLEKGADPDIRPEGNDSALMGAVWGKHTEAASLLVQYNGQIDPPDELRNYEHWEPMESAVEQGLSDIIRILAEGGADVNRRFLDGGTLVHKGLNNTGLGALLEFRPILDVKDNYGNTPLHKISRYTPLENIKLLVRARSDINATNSRGATPLIQALMETHEEAAKYYLSKNADINICSSFYGTALHAACLGGMLDLAKELIGIGADVNLTMDNAVGTPLVSALLSGSEIYGNRNTPFIEFGNLNTPVIESEDWKMELTNILIDAEANIAAPTGFVFGTVGVAAAWGCSSDEIIALTCKGANFNVGDSMGRWPVHIAAARGLTSILYSVLDAGNRATQKDKGGRNAVSWAAQGGNLDIFLKLLELTGDQSIHEPDLSGWTPLSWAARGRSPGSGSETGQCDIIKELLRLGADRSVRSQIQGKEYTPLGIAMYHGRDQDLLKLFTTRGEDNRQLGNIDVSQSSESTDGIPHLAENTQLTDGDGFCDFCLLDIEGIRYDCTTCSNFCFCYKCYSLKDILHPLDHEFIAVGDEFRTSSAASQPRSPSPVPSLSDSSSVLSSNSED